MKKMIAALVLATSTMLSVPAFAQRTPSKAKATAKAPKEHVQEMKFEPLGIEGGLAGPDSDLYTAGGKTKFKSFDLVRHTFYDKLVRTTENL